MGQSPSGGADRFRGRGGRRGGRAGAALDGRRAPRLLLGQRGQRGAEPAAGDALTGQRFGRERAPPSPSTASSRWAVPTERRRRARLLHGALDHTARRGPSVCAPAPASPTSMRNSSASGAGGPAPPDLLQRLRRRAVGHAQQAQQDMLGGDVGVLEAGGLGLGSVRARRAGSVNGSHARSWRLSPPGGRREWKSRPERTASGRYERARTADLYNANVALSQLSYRPKRPLLYRSFRRLQPRRLALGLAGRALGLLVDVQDALDRRDLRADGQHPERPGTCRARARWRSGPRRGCRCARSAPCRPTSALTLSGVARARA